MMDMFKHMDMIEEACPSSQLDTSKKVVEKPKKETKIVIEEEATTEEADLTETEETEEVDQESIEREGENNES